MRAPARYWFVCVAAVQASLEVKGGLNLSEVVARIERARQRSGAVTALLTRVAERVARLERDHGTGPEHR